MTSPTDVFFEQIAHVAGLATICEVRMRILADNTPVLTHLAHAQKLEDVENAIFKSFGKFISEEEIEKLKGGRVIRNKVLHGNFEAASLKLSEIAPNRLSKPAGFALDLATGEVRPIGSQPIKSSSIFEWVLAIGESGFFPVAVEVLTENIATIDRLMEQNSKGEIQPESP